MILLNYVYQANNYIERLSTHRVLLALLGTMIGFTQMWRVPALALEHGGIYFLIAYGSCLLTIGNAACLMEAILSQYTSKSCVEAFSVIPLSTGLGYSSLIYSFVCLTFNIQLSVTLFFYLLISLRIPITWSFCTKERIRYDSYNCSLTPNSCYDPTHCKYPTEFFWRTFLGWEFPEYSHQYGNLGEPILVTVTSMFAGWILTFFAAFQTEIIRNYISFFVIIIIYPTLIIILIIGLTMQGGTEGFLNLFSYSYTYLLRIETWTVSLEQAFYSLGIGTGVLGHIFKQFPFSLKCDRSLVCISIIVLIANITCTAFLFTVLGTFAFKSSTNFSSLTYGPGLWYMAISEAGLFGHAQNLTSFLLFLNLYTLAVGTIATITENLEENFTVICPRAKNVSIRYVFLFLTLGFVLTYPVFLRAGIATYYGLFDHYILMYSMFFLVGCKFLFVSFGYGLGHFCEDIAFMYGWYPNRFYRYIWGSGGAIVFIAFLLRLIMWKTPKIYKIWSLSVGTIFIIVIILPTMICAALKFKKYMKIGYLKGCVKPHPDYFPADDFVRSKRADFQCQRQIF